MQTLSGAHSSKCAERLCSFKGYFRRKKKKPKLMLIPNFCELKKKECCKQRKSPLIGAYTEPEIIYKHFSLLLDFVKI